MVMLRSPISLHTTIAHLNSKSSCLSQLPAEQSQKFSEIGMTKQGIEVKVCQKKMRELVAFLNRNGTFFPSPTRFLTSLKFMFEHEYYTDTPMPNLCIGG